MRPTAQQLTERGYCPETGAASLPLTITIPGPVIGKGRPRFVRATGRAFTPAPTANAEARLAHEVALLWKHPPLDEALSMRLEVRVAVPASKNKKFKAAALAGYILPVGRPDLDNIVKLVGDSLNGILWTDDSRIASIMVRRRYSENPGLTLMVSRA